MCLKFWTGLNQFLLESVLFKPDRVSFMSLANEFNVHCLLSREIYPNRYPGFWQFLNSPSMDDRHTWHSSPHRYIPASTQQSRQSTHNIQSCNVLHWIFNWSITHEERHKTTHSSSRNASELQKVTPLAMASTTARLMSWSSKDTSSLQKYTLILK